MTPKQVKQNVGKVVEYQGKLWNLLGWVVAKGGFYNRPRVLADLGARGERFTIPPACIKLADYPGQ